MFILWPNYDYINHAQFTTIWQLLIIRLVGNLVNGYQKDIDDLFGEEGGEIGKNGLRADVTSLPEMYPPPKATRAIPIRIDFFNNSNNVNVGHFNNASMPSHDGSGTPLLEQYLESRTTDTHGGKSGMDMTSSKMKITSFDSNEVSTVCLSSFSESNICNSRCLASRWCWFSFSAPTTLANEPIHLLF